MTLVAAHPANWLDGQTRGRTDGHTDTALFSIFEIPQKPTREKNAQIAIPALFERNPIHIERISVTPSYPAQLSHKFLSA